MRFVNAALDGFKPVQWLWQSFIQRGTINLITAAPGVGKSTVTCEIAAALSTGKPLPGEDPAHAAERGIVKTLMLNAEDDPEDTISWRLRNQGADRSKIWRATHVEPIGEKAAKDIFDLCRSEGIGLITLDPVQAWIGADTDMYRPNHVRAWGNIFKNLCAATGATVLWVRHRRKGDADDHNSLNSGLGSIDFSGIVRCELSITEVKAKGADRACKIQRIKGNIGKRPEPLYYEIKDTSEPDNVHGQLIWAHDVKEYPKEPRGKAVSKGNNAQNAIIQYLINGPKPSNYVIDYVERLTGAKKSTIYNAAEEVVVAEDGPGGKYWRLKAPADRNGGTNTPTS